MNCASSEESEVYNERCDDLLFVKIKVLIFNQPMEKAVLVLRKVTDS